MLPGAIYRIALENFVTYKQVELYPGSNLNVIIGPNGTGKSTFVCAIILGLCGKTSVIGRAKKISEYVRSGCQEATIELELIRDENSHVTITRTFNLDGQSNWYLDRKPAREKQVQELIATLNIQVDNLCQLLPQDKVQDFSKMDPQQLLRSTLSAVGGQESVASLDRLIESRAQQRNLTTKLANNAQTLQEQQRLNDRLKGLIDAMQQRKEIEREIEMCEKKRMWAEYQELREKVNECNRDRKEAIHLVETHKQKMEPLSQIIDKAKSTISVLEQKKLAASREMNSFREKLKESVESANALNYQLADLERDLREQQEWREIRERELLEARAKLEKLVTDRDRLQRELGDADKVKLELAELQAPIRRSHAAIEAVRKEKLQVQYDLETNIAPQIRLYQNKIKNLEDVAVKRLQALRNYNEDCYQAVMWYRGHRDMFSHAVYEPMVLEINFTDPKFARYLENTVAMRDLVAFTFESSQDMNLFLKKVRQERGLKMVNAICSPPSNAQFQSPCAIQQLSYLGFYSYVIDTIAAPDAITRFLCRQYQIHRIPIGNDHTYNNSGKVPSNITNFFTENHRFTVRTSAYSGATSSSTVEIRPASLLANSVDVDTLSHFNEQLSKFEQTDRQHRDKINVYDTQIAALETTLNQLLTQRKSITDNVEKMKTISAQIRLHKQKVSDIENESILDFESAKRDCAKRQRDCVIKQCKHHMDIVAGMSQIHSKLHNIDLWKVKLELSRAAIVQQEGELRELKNELHNVQATLENIETLLKRTKTNAVDKLREAKRACGNKLPQDEDFPYKEEFDSLPADSAALQQHCFELQSRIECMDHGDEQVLREYEERERLIRRLTAELQNSGQANQEIVEEMNRLKAEWLPPLEQLIRKINGKFGEMFARMGCAGEVRLDKADNEEDYDKYGICVSVRFREEEQLQQLNRHTQSGGERALSTALYLMSLQRLATVPFRCVDEINQGMDPMNERKMFQLLVKVTTENEDAQYFLLTPKLLANLEYNDHITVHTIMNGKRIINYRKWKCKQFLERARASAVY